MKIDYVANVRLPTYRAHGIQIMSMCDALARAGHSVRLIVPEKRHTVSGPADPFDYYGFKKSFEIVRVPAFDFLGRTTLLGPLLYVLDLFSFVHRLRWGRYLAGDVTYVRDPFLLSAVRGKQAYVELHELRSGGFFVSALKKAKHIFALTHALKEDLIARGVDATRVSVLPDAVDLSLFEHPETKAVARTRLGLSEKTPVAMYVGRLDGWKGLETVYGAAELLTGIEVVVIGGDEVEIPGLQQAHPKVRFLGPRPYRELKDNMAAADVLLLPNTGKDQTSARHTSPLKLFAYMTSGVPIVASDLPSLRDVIDESSAILVEPDNAEALAHAVQEIVAAPEKAQVLAAESKRRVAQYSWDARAQVVTKALA